MKRHNGSGANGRRGRGALRTGKADVPPDLSSHVPGVRQGNAAGNTDEDHSLEPRDPEGLVGTAARSTGINPDDREPIDPRMPHLSPP